MGERTHLLRKTTPYITRLPAPIPPHRLDGVGREPAMQPAAGEGDPHPAVAGVHQADLGAAVQGELLGVLRPRYGQHPYRPVGNHRCVFAGVGHSILK